jgi:hypothetical protein
LYIRTNDAAEPKPVMQNSNMRDAIVSNLGATEVSWHRFSGQTRRMGLCMNLRGLRRRGTVRPIDDQAADDAKSLLDKSLLDKSPWDGGRK